MDSWDIPIKTLKQLQQRLGFTNYFREYCPLYAALMAPLEALKSQGEKIKWLPEHNKVIAKFRKILEEKILLQYPDFSKPLFVGTDASKYGIGCILYQIDEKGEKKYIRLASRSLAPSERNYGAPQRELLAVLFALRAFYLYLFGHRFTLYTDHKALTFLLKRPKISSVIRNWLDEILQFDFEMIHLPGLLNHLPDRISRIYDFDPREPEPDYNFLLTVIKDDDLLDEDFGSLKSGIYSGSLDDNTIETDLNLRRNLMERAHLMGHIGAADMARSIRSSKGVTWPNIVRECQDLVSSCLPCQRYNVSKHGYHPPKNVTALLPFDHLFVDLKEMPLRLKATNTF
jgi:hypothetical protein